MMLFFLVFLLCALFSEVSFSQESIQSHTTSWEDDFNGVDINTSIWKIHERKRGGAQQTRRAVSIEDGYLKIRTFTENKINYTGYITSAPSYLAYYGLVQAKIRFIGESGLHCAFWLQSKKIGKILNDTKTAGSEIDIVENRKFDRAGNFKGNVAMFNLHWDGYDENHKTDGGVWKSKEDLNGAWHIYALRWHPTGYDFIVDNEKKWSSTKAPSSIPEEIRLTCEIGGNNGWSGTVPKDGYGPYETAHFGMDVDWVRVTSETN